MSLPPVDLKELASSLHLPFAEELPQEVDRELTEPLPLSFARSHSLVPLKDDGTTLTVALSDPLLLTPIEELRILYKRKISLVLAEEEEIQNLLNRCYSGAVDSAEESMNRIEYDDISSVMSEVEEASHDILDAEESAPIVRLINSIFHQAIRDRASDIHIEPYEKEMTVRFRVDGVLYNIISPQKHIQPYIISRIKVMGGMDIAEKRLPQDGRTRLRIGDKEVDVRISVLPTIYGERVVMRLLQKSSGVLGIDTLGFSPSLEKRFRSLIRNSSGIILLTGPTGSGKTTTLYSALHDINSPEKNIITIEDPIEYQLKGIGQIQVNAKIDLSFANGLRSILRQDPDVIMVGEIRDKETAEIAVNASLTGHLVFSTLHTNDAVGAISRLIDMGIEPFLLSSSIIGVMAQRLVRELCPHCKIPYTPQGKGGSLKGITLYRAKGCAECMNTGYQGRVAIFEMLEMSDKMRQLVSDHASSGQLTTLAKEEGMQSLKECALEKVRRGETSTEEVLRVLNKEG